MTLAYARSQLTEKYELLCQIHSEVISVSDFHDLFLKSMNPCVQLGDLVTNWKQYWWIYVLVLVTDLKQYGWIYGLARLDMSSLSKWGQGASFNQANTPY
jgi:hypothetical protein